MPVGTFKVINALKKLNKVTVTKVNSLRAVVFLHSSSVKSLVATSTGIMVVVVLFSYGFTSHQQLRSYGDGTSV